MAGEEARRATRVRVHKSLDEDRTVEREVLRAFRKVLAKCQVTGMEEGTCCRDATNASVSAEDSKISRR